MIFGRSSVTLSETCEGEIGPHVNCLTDPRRWHLASQTRHQETLQSDVQLRRFLDGSDRELTFFLFVKPDGHTQHTHTFSSAHVFDLDHFLYFFGNHGATAQKRNFMCTAHRTKQTRVQGIRFRVIGWANRLNITPVSAEHRDGIWPGVHAECREFACAKNHATEQGRISVEETERARNRNGRRCGEEACRYESSASRHRRRKTSKDITCLHVFATSSTHHLQHCDSTRSGSLLRVVWLLLVSERTHSLCSDYCALGTDTRQHLS